MVLRTAKVVGRAATRRAILSHVEQDLLVNHGVRIVVRLARFASVHVPAGHHVRSVHTSKFQKRIINILEGEAHILLHFQ